MTSRLNKADERFTEAAKNAQTRHEQVLFAIQQLADYTTLAQRVARLELTRPA